MNTRLSAQPARVIDSAGIALLLVVIATAYALGIHPALDRRAAAELDRATLITESENAKAATSALQDALARRDAILARQGTQLILESADQTNSRISRLTALAAAEKIAIQQLTPGAATREPGKPFISVPIRVQGSGEFADCVAFLSRLREEHQDIAVPTASLAVAQPASENQAARLDITLDLVWYAAPDDPAARR
jgi:hypothetical protein